MMGKMGQGFFGVFMFGNVKSPPQDGFAAAIFNESRGNFSPEIFPIGPNALGFDVL